MTTSSKPQSSGISLQEVWMRWMLFWHGLFYVSLVVATGLSLTQDSFFWQESVALVSLSLLLGIWYGVCIVVSPRYWHRHPLLTLGYLAIGWVLWFGLTSREPVYLFVLTGLYPQTFVLLLIPWNLIGGCILLIVSLWRQVAWSGGWNTGAFFTLGTGLAGMFLGLFIHTVVRQSRERKHLIEELEATRQELALAERQAGIMQERQRLAGEIHDTFTQGFSSIVMQIEAVEVSLPVERKEIKLSLDRVCRIARENLTEARRLLWALQPESLERASLPEVVVSLTAHWAEESNVAARAIITGTPCPLRPEIEVTLLRAAQETLANVRKHAQASSVALTLSYLGSTVALDVQDDGIGFHPCQVPLSPIGQTTGSFGLKALRERVEQLRGTLTLESAPGEGTTIAVALPASRHTALLES
jgi:signal transduction histidine kinase